MNARVLVVLFCSIAASVIAYGSGPQLTGWTCSTENGNCNFECLAGSTPNDNDNETTEYCAVFWQGNDQPLNFKVCVPSTDPMDTCEIVALPNGEQPATCPGLRYKRCGIQSSGNGCQSPIPGSPECNCSGASDGTDDITGDKTCQPKP